MFGLPIAFQYIVIAISGIVVQYTINLQGSIFIAGYTATNKLYGLLESSAICNFIHVYRNVMLTMGNSFWTMISGFAECAVRITMAKVMVLYYVYRKNFYNNYLGYF